MRAAPALIALLGLSLAASGGPAFAIDPPLSRAAHNPAVEAVEMVSDRDRACMTEAIYFEAQPSSDSQQAVGHVILNRAKDGRFPESVCGVVREGCQFSYRCSGRSLTLKDGEKRRKAAKAAEVVLAGARDTTGGALFFHSAKIKPGWSRKKTGLIGGNVFYR